MGGVLARPRRRAVMAQWPRGSHTVAWIAMAVLWPIGSLWDAITLARYTQGQARGGKSRMAIATGAWAGALSRNLPPADYIAYRLFEPGRPEAGRWLHSADGHLLMSSLPGPALREVTSDKLRFASVCERAGVPTVPVFAAFGPGGVVRAFSGGAPPPMDLLIKPRFGHGAQGLSFWQWDGERHNLVDGDPGPLDLSDALHQVSTRTEVLVQPWEAPSEVFGTLVPDDAPVLSLYTVQWPDGGWALAHAHLVVVVDDVVLHLAPSIEGVGRGHISGLPPGSAQPIWRDYPVPPPVTPFTIEAWDGIIAGIGRMARALPVAPVLKWDVLLGRRGPQLLEANIGPGIHTLQATTLEPLLDGPLGRALEVWAK